jgi:hypothetical protein
MHVVATPPSQDGEFAVLIKGQVIRGQNNRLELLMRVPYNLLTFSG